MRVLHPNSLSHSLSPSTSLHPTPIYSVNSKGASEYRIDRKAVTAEQYSAKLASMGLNIKSKNFLVFQGDVESIAQKAPKALTALFESISGYG